MHHGLRGMDAPEQECPMPIAYDGITISLVPEDFKISALQKFQTLFNSPRENLRRALVRSRVGFLNLGIRRLVL